MSDPNRIAPKVFEPDSNGSKLSADLSNCEDTPIGLVYGELLDNDSRWALSEGSRHFEGDSAVFSALHNIADRLKSLGIPYAVVGGMALFQHGFRRFTEDVDILVTNDDLKIIHKKLEGLGYRPPFRNSKHLRDTEFGVKIEFLTTGAFPGDGKEKPIAFPDPATVSFEADGINYINLNTFIELKLASGMTGAGRLKDLADVLELIKVLGLPSDFSTQLNPFVKDQFDELWKQARQRFVLLWRNKWVTSKANSVEEMIEMLRAAADLLEQMRIDGVTVANDGGIGDDYATLVTDSPLIAKKYGFVEESEIWDVEEDEIAESGT